MPKKNLIIINNEKIFQDSNGFYCENLDLKILPEELNKYHSVEYIARKSRKRSSQQINLKNIKPASNIFKFIYFILKTFKTPNSTYLLICITPYTFLSFLILFLFRKKNIFVYLFSSGHEEYRHILGGWAVWFYHIMYKIVTSRSKVIVCHERLHDKEKSYLVYISRLDNEWLENNKPALLDKARFLYVGRMSQEKGIFDFIKIFDQISFDAQLSIAGDTKKQNFFNKNIKLLGYIANQKSLINIYDEHNIMVLPSYTEATPYVLDESLSRKRPVIIFEDIAYIVRDKIGVFISKRNINSFSETTKYILKNYAEIQKKMEKNILPTKKDMINQISKLIEVN